MEKPKLRIIMTTERLYALANKGHFDLVSNTGEEIRIRLDDNVRIHIREISEEEMDVIKAIPLPPSSIN